MSIEIAIAVVWFTRKRTLDRAFARAAASGETSR